MSSTRVSLVALAIVTSVLGARPAHAALDEVMVTSAADVSHTAIAGQTVHVRVRGNLREYAGADGKIFAAKWNGPMQVGFMDLIAAYKDEFAAGMQTRRHFGHAHLFVRTPSLEVSQFSHNRLLRGHAFVVSHMPQGVTINALP